MVGESTKAAARIGVDRVRPLTAARFEQVFAEQYASVYRLALSMAGNPSDAEDISQEVFMAVLKALPKFRGEAKIGTWVYRIAIRIGTRWLARRPDFATAQREATVKNDPALPLDLLRALSQLPVNDRVILGLVGIEGLSHREAAQTLGIPEGTVASRLHHARSRLERRLNQ